MIERENIKKFQNVVWKFYRKNRRDFPWRETTDPYKILVSEIMLQQTQADRVVPFYQRFIKKFPTVSVLSKAPFGKIYPYWQGLGYNRRALALQKLAREVVEKYDGKLPKGPKALQELPGIGPYTAQAVSIFSDNRPLVCLETNIRRVFIHHFFPEADVVSDEEILPLLDLALPVKKSREWHWALMDYGSHLRSTLSLSKGGNPNRRHKNYAVQSKFEGSLRQIRGAVLKNLAEKKMTEGQLLKSIERKPAEIKMVLNTLQKEGFIEYKNNQYSLT